MKYDHYLALDWAQSNMAIAHATKFSDEIQTIDVVSDIKNLKAYLKQFRGTKILTFEETSPAHWLYTELYESVDEILVCEPYTNHLLKSGPKTDRTDAIKLLKLLKANMLKPVFHCNDKIVYLRKIVSGHDDLIHTLVQLKHRKTALFRARGLKPETGLSQFTIEEKFVFDGLNELIRSHEIIRLRYRSQLRKIVKENEMAKNLTTVPGIGYINAVKLVATVIEPKRFKHKTGFWLYCGLQKFELISGGRSYGKRSPRYSRRLKSVFKTAALVSTKPSGGALRKYYLELIENKKYPEHQARHALARRIATLALGVMKSGKPLTIDK